MALLGSLTPSLTIQEYSDAARAALKGTPCEYLIKRDSMEMNLGNDFIAQRTLGAPSGGQVFQGSHTAELSITLLLAEPVYTDPVSFALGDESVDKQISKLYQQLFDINGSSHHPPYLALTLSSGLTFPYGKKTMPAVLKSMKIQSAQHDVKKMQEAIVSCVFLLQDTRQNRLKDAKLNSPDLTHYRQLIAGDRLDYKTWQIYGDSTLAAQVARSNDLDSPRLLAAGQTIAFAPYQAGEPS